MAFGGSLEKSEQKIDNNIEGVERKAELPDDSGKKLWKSELPDDADWSGQEGEIPPVSENIAYEGEPVMK